MTEEEKAILLDIDSLYKELLAEPFGKWNGKYKAEPSAYNYCRNAEMLKNKVFELFNKYKPDYLLEHQLGAVSHTCGKEVSSVEYSYGKTIKRNAPKKRYAEFMESIDKANNQIKLDLYSVFAKIKEVQNK